MYRIDNASSATTLPAPSVAGPQPNGFFTGGNPTAGIQATRVDAEWLNMLQEELSNVILAAALTLNKGDRTQLLQAIRGLGRRRLIAPLTLYVASTGNDTTGDGFTPSTAWATPQRAWDWMSVSLDCGLQPVTVQLAPGSYPGLKADGQIPGTRDGTITFIGNVGDPTLTTLHGVNVPAIEAQNAMVSVAGLTVSSTGTGTPAGTGLFANESASLGFNNLYFGACGAAHIFVNNGAVISTVSTGTPTYTINGAAPIHLMATSQGTLAMAGVTVTINGIPHFTQSFVLANVNAVIDNWSCTWVGGATGVRYSVGANCTLNINGANANTYYPGDQVGVTSAGGVII